MSTWTLWYFGSVAVAACVLLISIAFLSRLLNHVLVDLLGSARRAHFFTLTFCTALSVITLAGTLVPAELLNLDAITTDELLLNSSKQLVGGAVALLIGMAFLAGILLQLILKFEARRP